ncbi:unnamed protein product [Ilex paraguariensis]|uniref:Germin-like protein n=1 Tax=Ilex paraguariensis TaxID=185542 RepID=A0ABC8V199_9AQUA
MANHFLLTIILVALASSFAYASDPSPLQDFCVAIDEPKDAVFVNGKFCKDPKLATADDFFFPGPKMLGLHIPRIRIDYDPNGLNAPHTHPHATKIRVVLEGTLHVGFATSNSNLGNRLFTKVLLKGDVFVYPMGLIHFQFNVGKTNVVAITAFSSQNTGVIVLPSPPYPHTKQP